MSQNQNQNNNYDSETMNVAFQDLDVLPEIPAGTKRLYCSGNKLVALPDLPEGLEVLLCSYNKITVLPALPSTLRKLGCDFNEIETLPALPAALEELACGRNKLKELPQLPAGLAILSSNSNELNTLPRFPDGMEFLSVSNNELTEIPKLPLGLVEANFDDNPLEEPYKSLYKNYKDSIRYNANGFSSGNIKQFIQDVNAIGVENAEIADLQVKRENYPQNVISQEDFVDGEKVDVLYSQSQYADLQAGRNVNIKPSMVYKHESIQGLMRASADGTIKNPLTRNVVAHREVRRLKFEEGGQAGGKKRKTKKKSYKKRVHKSRKNKASK
jgi:Leucine-rich repeat (LRR) protein